MFGQLFLPVLVFILVGLAAGVLFILLGIDFYLNVFIVRKD